MNKTAVINILETMDKEDFEMEEFINKLLFVHDIDQGLKDMRENKVFNYDEVKQRFQL